MIPPTRAMAWGILGGLAVSALGFGLSALMPPTATALCNAYGAGLPAGARCAAVTPAPLYDANDAWCVCGSPVRVSPLGPVSP